MRTKWQLYFSRPNKRIIFFASLFLLITTLITFFHFLTFNEMRMGFHFKDPILQLFSPVSVSEYIFFATYLLSVYGLITAFRTPAVFVLLLQAYILMTCMRMLCLYLLPLEPPDLIIPLRDSILQSSFYSGRENLKDLFFSGHTATVFLFVFCFPQKELKLLFAIGGTVVAVLLLLQHVHYSIDVLVAPIISYLAVVIQQKINWV
jgi:PAP2 superfamily C-terminal